MNSVIISANMDNLSRILPGKNGGYAYVTVDLDYGEVERFLEQKKYARRHLHEGLDGAGVDFRKEYIDFIGRQNRDNNSIYWLSNTMSYKGTFVSDLSQDIYSYYCLISLIKKAVDNYIIVSKNPTLNRCVKKYCDRAGIKCRILDRQAGKRAILDGRKYILSAMYFLRDGWTRKALVSIHLAKKIDKLLDKNLSYYVLRSWMQKKSFAKDKQYSDVFFGRLPDYLEKKGKRLIILVGALTDFKDLVLKLKGIDGRLIVPQEYFISYADYLKAVFMSFMHRPKLKAPLEFCGLDVSEFVKECLEKDYKYDETYKNLIYFYYAKRLLGRVKINTFVYTFENQAWERMTIFSFRKYCPSARVIGYAHSSIMQSPLCYFYSREEEGVIPLPDKIVTIGKEPKLLLEESGNYADKTSIAAGCALRYEYLFGRSALARSGTRKILVALSIQIGYSVKALKMLHEALAGKNEYEIVLRAHPFTPIDALMEKLNIKFSDNFTVSRNESFEEDLKSAGIFIYVDTTASIEALLYGIPAICLNIREAVNPDPLFKLNSLKWTVLDMEELRKTIDYIYSMPEKDYAVNYNSAREYLEEYFYPVEEKYLEEFV